MDLREHTVYLRCSTYRDLLDDGSIIGIVDQIEALTGERFVISRDMGSGHRQRPSRPVAGRKVLLDSVGLGMHMAARIRLSCTDVDDVSAVRLDVVAGSHPYTGTFLTTVDLRIPTSFFADRAFVERYVAFVRTLVLDIEPFLAHAHETDDTTIQNTSSAAILRRGFGVDIDSDPVVPENPGVEVSRGEFRYVATWLMVYGPEMVSPLGSDVLLSMPGKVETLGPETFLVRLFEFPDDAASPEARARQRAARETLQFERLMADKAWAFGFWDRKSRGDR